MNALTEHRHSPESAGNCPASVTPLSGICQAAQGEGTVASTQQTDDITLYFLLGCGCRKDPASRLQGCTPSTRAQSRAISAVLWALAESFAEPTSREQCCTGLPSRSFLQASPTPCTERDLGGQSRRLGTWRDDACSYPSPTLSMILN